jgi:hypothetical protein
MLELAGAVLVVALSAIFLASLKLIHLFITHYSSAS